MSEGILLQAKTRFSNLYMSRNLSDKNHPEKMAQLRNIGPCGSMATQPVSVFSVDGIYFGVDGMLVDRPENVPESASSSYACNSDVSPYASEIQYPLALVAVVICGGPDLPAQVARLRSLHKTQRQDLESNAELTRKGGIRRAQPGHASVQVVVNRGRRRTSATAGPLSQDFR